MSGANPSWRGGLLASFVLLVLLFGGFCGSQWGFAQDRSLADRIDALSRPEFHWTQAEGLSDVQALRRLSLDLRNTVPTPEEYEAFLATPIEGRWGVWVERFFADPLHQERMVDWYDKTLMQRRAFQNVDRVTWMAYLRRMVDAKTPLDQVLRGLVRSSWWNRAERAEQRFFLDRGGDSHAIARDIGRVFFGRDMQCAQCHDHPQIDDYHQLDYHGILAFVSPSALVEGKTTDEKGAEQKLQMYVEKAPGDAPFESVFNKGVSFRSASRVPGSVEKAEAYLAPDQRIAPTAPEGAFGGLPNPPVQSRRGLLAEQLQGSNRAFAENWANRIWAIAFGRGLVHPLDMHHFDNPPSNPELLSTLTDALVVANFQVDELLKQICMSETYRRGRRIAFDGQVDERSVIRIGAPEAIAWRGEIVQRKGALEAELLELSKQQDAAEKAYEAARDAWREVQKSRVVLRAELDGAEGTFQEAMKKWVEANAAYDKALGAQNALSQKIQLLGEAANKLEQAKALGEDPELAASIQATRGKAEGLKPQLAPLEQATAAAAANRDSMMAAREAERGKWQGIVDRIMPVEQQLQGADAQMLGARVAYQSIRKKTTGGQQYVARLERWLQWFDRSAEVHSYEMQGAQLAMQRSAMLEGMTAMTGEKTMAEQAVVGIEASLAEAVKQLGQLDMVVQEVQGQVSKLAGTKASLIESKGLLGDASALDAALVAVEAGMVAKQATLLEKQTEQKAMQGKVAELQSQAKVTKEVLDAVAAKMKAQSDSIAALQLSEQELVTKQAKGIEECALLRGEFEEDLQASLAISPERALSPEQMGWSVLTATNVLPSYVQNELSEMQKAQALGDEATAEARRARQVQGVRGAIDKLQSNVDVFSNLYASGVGQTSDDFFASPDQALYVANGGSVFGWSAPNGNNLTNRVVQSTDPSQAVRLLTLGLLGRYPTAQEQELFTEVLSKGPESKPAMVHELVWAILAGAEFRLYP